MKIEEQLNLGGGFGGGISLEMMAAQVQSELGLNFFLSQLTEDLKIELSAGAVLMLLIPLLEIKNQRNKERNPTGEHSLGMDLSIVEETLFKLIQEMADSPAADDKIREEKRQNDYLYLGGNHPQRTSLSAIKAFWAKFCNIPPLCGETKE